MNFKILTEEFKLFVKDNQGRIFSIHKNPSKSEFKEIIKETEDAGKSLKDTNEVRFIIDRKKKAIYVFSYKLLHHKAAEKLKLPYDGPKAGDIITGQGTYSLAKNKIITPSSRPNQSKWLNEYLA